MCLQQEGEGTVSAMVVEKQKLDLKVKEMKDRVQVSQGKAEPSLPTVTDAKLALAASCWWLMG